MKSRWLKLSALMLGLVLPISSVDAQGMGPDAAEQARVRSRLSTVRARLSVEPRAREVVRAALEYFRIHPEAIDQMRSNARMRALLPVLTGGYSLNDTRTSQSEVQMISDPRTLDQSSAVRDNRVTTAASWDLRELMFNGDQVQVYSLVGVQRDIMLEVVRAFYARRQLLIIVSVRPPEDPIAAATMEQRIDEFTTTLDMLTGDWFSRTVEQRLERSSANTDGPAY